MAASRAALALAGGLTLTIGLAAWPIAMPVAKAEACTEAQIAATQDAGSAALRRLNGTTTPQIDARMRELQKLRGWSDHDLDEKAYEQLGDATLRTFDAEMAALITRMETLSEPSSSVPVCERLLELRQTLDRMREIAQQKSRYMMAKLDRELTAKPAAPVPPVQPPTAALPKVAAKGPEPKGPEPKAPEPQVPWTTTTRVEPRVDSSVSREPPPATSAEALSAAGSSTYARDEIFAAGQGFFGKISSGLASVLDFALQKAGQPSGYILGDEGGGAFIAGVRYGQGVLHLKGRPTQEVFWRGPSIGYDVGAAGSRLMVLVYNVRDPEELFTSFAGVDGSAYLVGGVGVTFLTNGRKALAPIRSGIGLRLGANIGYLKFSHKPSWNPF